MSRKAPDKRTRTAKKPSRRGGRRPGAGAPRGNLNALRTGRRSAQVQAAVEQLLSRSDTGPVMAALVHLLAGDTAGARRSLSSALQRLSRRRATGRAS